MPSGSALCSQQSGTTPTLQPMPCLTMQELLDCLSVPCCRSGPPPLKSADSTFSQGDILVGFRSSSSFHFTVQQYLHSGWNPACTQWAFKVNAKSFSVASLNHSNTCGFYSDKPQPSSHLIPAAGNHNKYLAATKPKAGNFDEANSPWTRIVVSILHVHHVKDCSTASMG